jgi:hypothetical protein
VVDSSRDRWSANSPGVEDILGRGRT